MSANFQKCGIVRTVGIWLGAHAPSTVADEPREHLHRISLIGWTVALAALFTGANWGVAGFHLAGGEGVSRWLVGFGAAILGALLIVVVDRAGIYALDSMRSHALNRWMFWALRLGLSLLISSFTVQALAPLILYKEAKVYALHERERNDLGRAKSLNERFGIDRLRGELPEIEADLQAARVAAAAIPAEIGAQESFARACWGRLSAQRASLISKGLSDSDARRTLAPITARCTLAANTARLALDAYKAKTRKAIGDLETRKGDALSSLTDAEHSIKEKLTNAETIESDAIVPESSVVISGLLASDWGAWKKFYESYLFIVAFELLPLFLKGLFGPSAPGVRIAVEHEIAVADHDRRRQEAAHAAEQLQTLRDVFDEARDTALQSVATREQLRALFEANIAALAPLDLARRSVAQIEGAIAQRQASARRNPKFAELLNTLWDEAFAKVAASLRGGVGMSEPTPT